MAEATGRRRKRETRVMRTAYGRSRTKAGRLAALVVVAFAAAGCSTTGEINALVSAVTANTAERDDTMYAEKVDAGITIPAVPPARLPAHLQRRVVSTPFAIRQYDPGTIVVDTSRRYLYLINDDGTSRRYGIGVGRAGFSWTGDATIRAKRKWPSWHPPKEMQERDPYAAEWAQGMPGGLANPLGARALYLFDGNRDTLYRLHGTNDPSSIGKAVSSGCVRMINQDIIDLYNHTPIGTKVVVLGEPQLDVDEIGKFFSSLLNV